MKKWVIFVLGVLALILVLVAASSIYIKSSILFAKTMTANLKVGDYVGINIDTDKIYFGTVPENGTSYREVLLNTSIQGDLIVTVSGPLKNSILLLNPVSKVVSGENSISFVGKPDMLKSGVYESEVHFFIVKHKTFLHSLFLKGSIVPVYDSSLPEQGGKVAINILNPANGSVNNSVQN